MTRNTTLVPMPERRRLAADPDLGAGNVLQAAINASPDPQASLLTLQQAVPDAHGQLCRDFNLIRLQELVTAWARHYWDRGVRQRDRVAVWISDSFENHVQYFALTTLGAIPVLLNGELSAETVGRLCEKTTVVGVHTDQLRAAALAYSGFQEGWVQVSDDVKLPEAKLPARARFQHAATDPVLICHSSGTTGDPKPVIWTHGQAMAGIRPHLENFLSCLDARLLSVLPQSHASAVGYLLMALLTGTPTVLQSSRDADTTRRAIDAHQATAVVGFADTFAGLATTAEPGPLATVETWISVGDAAHHAHIAELVRHGRHRRGKGWVAGSLFVDGLGASELGWGGVLARYVIPGISVQNRCLGRPQPYVDIAVLRADGTLADPGEVGMLGVRGPTITPGYWGDHNTTYRSQLNGYWLSGDLAWRNENGELFHADRLVDAIRSRTGEGYSLLMEETLLTQIPEVSDWSVISVEIADEPWVVGYAVSAGAAPPELLEQANQALTAQGHPPLDEVRVMPQGALPVGATGKVLKRELRSQYVITVLSEA
ncbi:class I adenylate-forming enzyme family protein [Streptomyces mirabilis]|uniref:Class I adenylate-forming enzyme family protein n=1 Tax=Streptomyces mirabilis TaxID=68239 RepID=A0ABU3UXS5_9ACTN|nr:class I adenylate-forming enzyme family protein [Streptomyces mirabilis]MDU8998721.1 class I adenylate-forming enzyme family protein [Streptomyces mirabilis]